MIIVFWRVVQPHNEEDHIYAEMKEFGANQLTDALKFAEELRASRKAGARISHVCMQSELPDVVGEAGVGDAPKDYDWRKRREDPSTFGRKPNLSDDAEVDFE